MDDKTNGATQPEIDFCNCGTPLGIGEGVANESEILTVGAYTITHYHDDGYWIDKGDGEGMQVFEKNFIDLVDKFYREEF